jgi:Zn-dependent alcohol dehydrogenase
MCRANASTSARAAHSGQYKQGKLDLDRMVSRTGKLEDVNDAFRAMKAGEVARTVLMFD